jgi:hypothetical protein
MFAEAMDDGKVGGAKKRAVSVRRHSPGRAENDTSREHKTCAQKDATAPACIFRLVRPRVPKDQAVCGCCKGWSVSRGNEDEGLTCCEFSGELFGELCGLGVIDRLTMYSSGKELKRRRFQ